ncbi:alkaline phosphatase-like protein [Coniochaeta sp. 2T2.1]|nr:alkaline phosphatase-like protein [Coniochaeta sp. 2T2.1]
MYRFVGRPSGGSGRSAEKLVASVSLMSNSIRERVERLTHGTVSSTEVLIFSTASAAVFACSIWYLRRMAPDRSAGTDTAPKEKNVKVFASPQSESYDPKTTDPPLLKKHSEYKSYTTSRFTYSGLRIFYRRHTQADQLPNAPPLPLLVCLHGLGGSVAQFHPLLTSLTNISNCLAIDLPGCGASDFTETSWDAYKTDALVELLELIIEDYRDKAAGQGVVLIAHSMGCSLGARLASKAVPHTTDLHNHVMGLVAICPESGPPTEQQVSFFRKLLWIPGPLFDLWRAWDRRGGPESASVCRFVGADADAEAKRLQHLYNNQSRTPVWRRMASGCLPVYENGVPKGGLPGKEVWAGLDIPVYLIGGELDNVTKPAEVGKIVEILKVGAAASDSEPEHQGIVDAAAPVDTTDANASVSKAQSITDITEDDFTRDRRLNNTDESQEDPDPSTPSEPSSEVPPLPQHPQKVVKSIILPAPATHALLYTPSTARVLAGLVSDFLASHVSGRLSLGWQLQYLSREGKWDVKNLEKWKKVAPVSEPIAGVFRAMKTLRELDETHTPSVFVKNWGHVIKDIVDISHDSPVYDPRGLETGGVQYHKLPTVSKIPPTDVEVNVFIATVDRLRAEQEKRAKEQNWDKDYVIGVHCHYGFNRTGYFIVCYIVERCGYSVKDAIDAFAKARPNGIRHSHFLDNLHLRVATGNMVRPLSTPSPGGLLSLQLHPANMLQPNTRNPLLADTRRASLDSVEADEEDALLRRPASSPSSRRFREWVLFTWAFLATVAVIVLAVFFQHRQQTSPTHDDSTSPSSKRNLIFMVSDGMGPTSLSMTRSFRQLVDGLPIDDTLVLDRHFWGTSRTRSSSSLVTDSAAGATAFSCGRKSYNGAIAVDPDHQPCGTVLEAARRAGYKTGLVVTTDVTDATPASFAAHVYWRFQNDEIALQEVGESVLGRSVDLLFGGGRCRFLPNSTEGSCRGDGVDVAALAQEKHGWTYADDRAGFEAMAGGKNVSLPALGLFASGDVPFEIDRRGMGDVYPSLSEMAATAIKALADATKDSEKGFFLMIEGSRIDHAGHFNDPAAQVREVLEYDATFQLVLDFLDKSDTEGVLVATSDHETGGLATAWQTPGQQPVYDWHPAVLAKADASAEYLAALLNERVASSVAQESKDSLKDWINTHLVIQRLGIANALDEELAALAANPGAAVPLFAGMVSRRARIGWSTGGHSAVDVNVYSSGEKAAEKIRGNVENTDIGKFLREYLAVDVDEITRELMEKMDLGSLPVGSMGGERGGVGEGMHMGL